MKEIGTLHEFNSSLKQSHAGADLPLWEEIYRKTYSDFTARIDHRQNGEHQAAGIDASIILSNSKQLLADEKLRGRNKKTGKVYDDIALEYFSDAEAKTPGWVCKPLRADIITYGIAPLGIAHLLPVPYLQSAWQLNGENWIKQYPYIPARNYDRRTGRRWVTLSVGVPVGVLYTAIVQAFQCNFYPFEWDSENGAATPLLEDRKLPQLVQLFIDLNIDFKDVQKSLLKLGIVNDDFYTALTQLPKNVIDNWIVYLENRDNAEI